MCACKDAHQCRFAGTVFADEADDLVRPDFERDVLQCVNAGEGFADIVG